MDKLAQIRAVVDVWLSSPSDDPMEGATHSLSAICDILDEDDAIDATHADPELNRIADLRTLADALYSSGDDVDAMQVQVFVESAREVIDLCDAYIGLRSAVMAAHVLGF